MAGDPRRTARHADRRRPLDDHQLMTTAPSAYNRVSFNHGVDGATIGWFGDGSRIGLHV
jgi:hypothetical protein